MLPRCVHDASATPKVVSMKIGRDNKTALSKRDPQSVTPHNAVECYYVYASVGTPPQTVQLQIDSGSSGVWMVGSDAYQACSPYCQGGDYNRSQSSTYSLLAEGDFEITCVTPGLYVTGDYFSNVIALGEQSMQNLTMGVANASAAMSTGILGIGFDTEEAAVAGNGGQPYANIDVMVAQGLIQTRAYRLYLHDLDANTGAILFGGIDTEKYVDDLAILDMVWTNTLDWWTLPL
ncbi:hypothetical protein LTR08_005053 [Meristemomyces frigidus]|nr:hypothetical protein LTR08_005053 [Meristemomyces frigidus]